MRTETIKDSDIGSLPALCKWLADCNDHNISPKAKKMAKAIVLDTLACACLGASETEAQKLRNMAKFVDNGICTIIGGLQTDLMTAAFINGCQSQIHDGNDGFVHSEAHGVCAHPGRLVVPAALALGETLNASGLSIITAIAATYEAVSRLSKMDQYSRDMLPAALVAAKLLELSPDKIINAAGFAFHNAQSRTGFPGPMADEYFTGIGDHVRNGITSALLAHSSCHSGIPATDSLLVFDSDSQSTFMDSLYFKPYTACRNINAAADLVIDFRKESSAEPKRIEKIIVYLSDGLYVGKNRLDVGAERMPCQLNIYYSLTVAFHDGELCAAQYSDTRRNNPELHAWSRRIELMPETDCAKRDLHPHYARLEIFLEDGTVINKKTAFASWGPESFPSDTERHEKFLNWSAAIFSQQRAEQIIDVVENLENILNIKTLMQVLSKES